MFLRCELRHPHQSCLRGDRFSCTLLSQSTNAVIAPNHLNCNTPITTPIPIFVRLINLSAFQSLVQCFDPENDTETRLLLHTQIRKPLTIWKRSYVSVNSSLSSSNSRLYPTCYHLSKSLLRRLPPSSLHSPPLSAGMGISCLLAQETM